MSFDSAQAMLLGLALSDFVVRGIAYPKNNSVDIHLSERMLRILTDIEAISLDNSSNDNLLDLVILTYVYQDNIEDLRVLINSSHQPKALIASKLGIISLSKIIIHNIPIEDYFANIWKSSSGISKDCDMTIRKIGHVLGWGSEAHAVRHLGNGETPQEIVALVLYCILRYPNDYVLAVKCATQIPQNSVVIAQLVGALLGLKLGLESLPQTWVKYCHNRKYILKLAQDLYSQRLSNVK